MPLLWRYLIFDYLKVLALCTISFVAILLTLRFDEIAHFACLGSSTLELLQFIVLQLPYLLPIALPVSALIAAYVLFSRLSIRQELTALRSCGIGLYAILAPVLITAGLLTLADFYITSEISSTAHLMNGQLRHKLRTVNPLLLLQNKRILSMQGISCETLGASRYGEYASDVYFAIPDKKNHRIALILAKSIHGSNQFVKGEDVTFIATRPSEEGFDEMSVENIAELETPYEAFAPALQQKTWTVHPDHLKLAQLRTHLDLQNQLHDDACNSGSDKETCKGLRKNISQGYAEYSRRISVALSLFSFTLLGAAFSIQISRQQSRWSILTLGLLTGLYLLCYFLGKSMDDKWITATFIYGIPQIILIGLAVYKLWGLNHGRE